MSIDSFQLDGQNGMPEGMTVVAALQPQDIQLIQTHMEPEKQEREDSPVPIIKTEINRDDDQPMQAAISIPAQYLQPTSLHEYIQKMQNQSLPVSLQQFLKFNPTDIKREQITEDGLIEAVSIPDGQLIMQEIPQENEESVDDPNDKKKKKRYKKKPPKPKSLNQVRSHRYYSCYSAPTQSVQSQVLRHLILFKSSNT